MRPAAIRDRTRPGVLAIAVAVWTLAGCTALVEVDDAARCLVAPGAPDPCPGARVCRAGRCLPCDPAGPEVCGNGKDDDCDGAVDEGDLDVDGDGYRGCAEIPASPVDCDDTRAGARPGGVEVCDGRDGDCDGVADDGADCGEGLVCVDGRCAVPGECRAPGGCPADASCQAIEDGYACVEGPRCAEDGDCGAQACDVTSGRCVDEAGVAAGGACDFDRACPVGGRCDRVDPLDPGAGRVCGVVCGTDAECGAGEVCAASPDGARSCAPAAALGLVVGAGEGTPCTDGARCRSGVCDGGACVVRCSANRDCLARLDAGSCRLEPDDRGIVGRCVVGAEGPGPGDRCGPGGPCAVGACLAPVGGTGWCVALCGDGSDCGPGEVCVSQELSVGRLRVAVPVCRPPASPAATGGVGDRCEVDGDCVGHACVAGRCRSRCARPTDCPEGEGCRPRVTAAGRAAVCLPPAPW